MYGAYGINVCGEGCQVHKLVDLWEKPKLALCANFLILRISSRYCVYVCQNVHSFMNCADFVFVFFFLFFGQPRQCLLVKDFSGRVKLHKMIFFTFFMCLECANC